ncbi:MAG TPA: hypothetical protein VM299_06520 [Solirubrobacteraceae bacterium]|jgi:hypothetical protein|nr:hypothetical protein [Solirubrobacteraceae bacterium]
MERDPDAAPGTGDEDLLGDPDDVDGSIEDELDARLQAENDEDDDLTR